MSTSRNKIILIKFTKNREALLLDLEPPHRYDEGDSVDAYVSLLHQTLQAEYPEANIEISVDLQATHSEIETDGELPYDLKWNYNSLDGLESQEAIKQSIEELAEKVYQESPWRRLSRREWLNIADFCKRAKISAFILRWACEEEIIKSTDAKNVSGILELASDIIPSIKKDFDWLVGGKVLVITEVDDSNHFETHQETPDAYPLINQTMLISPNVLGIPIFSDENSLLRVSNLSGDIYICLEHFLDNLPWIERDWTYSKYINALATEATSRRGETITGEPLKTGGTTHGLKMQFAFRDLLPETLPELLASVTSILEESIQDTDIRLAGELKWKPEYEKSGGEDSFCREILLPLMRKLRYDRVRYTHGWQESGKDFVFSQPTPFGRALYFGLQAKAGNIKGGVRSDINEIVTQIELGFQSSFKEPGSRNEEYISCFIVAISGNFTHGADQVMLDRLERFIPKGSVFFLDKDKIETLISQLWQKDK